MAARRKEGPKGPTGAKRAKPGGADKNEFAKLAREIASPERLHQQGQRLLEGIAVDSALRSLRFDFRRVAAWAKDAAGSEGEEAPSPRPSSRGGEGDEGERKRMLERLVTDDLRAAARELLQTLAKAAKDLRAALPYRVGVAVIEYDRDERHGPGDSPFWRAVLVATAFEWPFIAFVRERLAPLGEAELRARLEGGEGVGGGGGGGPTSLAGELEAFLRDDARAKRVMALAEDPPIARRVGRFLVARDDLIPEVLFPLERVLHGVPVEPRLERRRRALAFATPRDPEREAADATRAWADALAKDAPNVVPVYRSYCVALALVAREAGAEEEAGGAEESDPDALPAAVADAIALETLPPGAHIGLFACYEARVRNAPEVVGEDDPAERAAVLAVLRAPLDPAPYRAFADHLRATGKGDRAALADAAIRDLFPEAPR